MENTFLSQVAKAILDANLDLSKTAIVLPNKRAQRMLLNALSKHYSTPFFSPRIFSINDFMAYLSPLEKLEKVPLIVQLFHTYRQLAGNDAEDFNTAMAWLPPFLDDISEVDMQLADGAQILKDLAGAKDFEIRYGKDHIGTDAERKILFYKLLSILYGKFRENLLQQNGAYDGMLYRYCAENMSTCHDKLSPFDHFVFAGFHVLNPAELEVVAYVKENFDTHLFFDVDPFYCDFDKNEHFTTAHFVQKIRNRLSLKEPIRFSARHYEEIPKDIQVVGTSKEMNQIFYAVQCLEEIEQTQGNLDDTALVLVDEQLLVPLLSAYDISKANVTMGYPFTSTPAYTLLSTLLELFNTHIDSQSKEMGRCYFHRRELLTLFNNPIIKNYLLPSKSDFRRLTTALETSRNSLCEEQELGGFPLPKFNGKVNDCISAVIDYLRVVMQYIPTESEDRLFLERTIAQLDMLQQQLAPLLLQEVTLTMSSLRYMIQQSIGLLTFPIKGDATRGLQIMGLLETRTLDFKNVIMLSVNEGVLPAGITHNSLLPIDFKFQGEALENYLYKDQVYAYHFFRLLQRAERVVLLYDNNCSDSLKEKSRFISQLEFEARERGLNSAIRLSYPIVTFPYSVGRRATVEVEKSESMLDQLKSRSYSASALNTYIRCPLQFYWRYVCHIQERTAFYSDKIAGNVIGTVVHAVLEKLLRVGEEAQPNFSDRIDEFLKDVEGHVKDIMLSDSSLQQVILFKEQDLNQGRLYLAYRTVCAYIRQYLPKCKEELVDAEILGNELNLECTLNLEHNGSIKLQGIIDRLQQREDHLEVVDYKTGKVDASRLKISMDTIGDLVTNPEYDKLLQLFLYVVLCKHSSNTLIQAHSNGPMRASIISMPNVNRGEDYFCRAQLYDSQEDMRNGKIQQIDFTDDFVTAFEDSLKGLFGEILNPAVKFSQTDDSKRCCYCDFLHFCNR